MKEELKGNKGEWSEVYTFLYLMSKGRLYGADCDLNRIDDVFYEVIKIIRDEKDGTLFFIVDENKKIIEVFSSDRKYICTLNMSDIGEKAKYLLETIINQNNTGTFSVPEITDFLNKIHCFKLKAPSKDKSDITIKVHDFHTGINPTLGFSIKSRLGKASTLLNAGKNTNFIYKLNGDFTDEDMNKVNSMFHIKKTKKGEKNEIAIGERLRYILSKDVQLKYFDISGKNFKNNLILIDTMLPSIISNRLLEYYSTGVSNIKILLDKIIEENPLNFDLSENHPFYSYKFKKFITESALGMLPGKVWTGKADATGGYIIVKEDGDVLCYHLYNRNEFEEYLLNNIKFEKASAKRHNFAEVYKKNNEYYINLNLQIRFIK
ncbi:HpaII family restriction endonuclease [Anaerofustis sp. HA2171]|uniref:HpaII family restriction endonuclease n=1 Tax=Anaerofustis butyriciformans TaxID=3108533 RepID=UPI002E350658|nr:HpaII family restriction endonuclease [Anaerofustis sp. HA2171]